MSIRSTSDLTRDILDAIDEIKLFTSGMDEAAFAADIKTMRAVELNFIVIGEAASKIPDAIQQAYPTIPWTVMKAMRNRLVHAYFSVDPKILWQTLQNDLPPLTVLLRGFIAKLP